MPYKSLPTPGWGNLSPPPGTLTPEGIYNQCNGVAGWKADAMAAGTTMNQALGTYTKVGGTAPLYKPDGADQAALQNAIGSVVEGLKSCVLDLPTNFEVDLGNLAGAKVTINGKDVAPDPENGWRMNSKTQLEFVGAACNFGSAPIARSSIRSSPASTTSRANTSNGLAVRCR